MAIVWDTSIQRLYSTKEADNILKNKDLSMLVIYAQWCGHCKKAAPEINKLAEKSKAKIFVIESEDYKGDKASGYPTIYIVKNSKSSKYEGLRDVESMSNALLGFSGGKRSRRSSTRRFRDRRRKTRRSLR